MAGCHGACRDGAGGPPDGPYRGRCSDQAHCKYCRRPGGQVSASTPAAAGGDSVGNARVCGGPFPGWRRSNGSARGGACCGMRASCMQLSARPATLPSSFARGVLRCSRPNGWGAAAAQPRPVACTMALMIVVGRPLARQAGRRVCCTGRYLGRHTGACQEAAAVQAPSGGAPPAGEWHRRQLWMAGVGSAAWHVACRITGALPMPGSASSGQGRPCHRQLSPAMNREFHDGPGASGSHSRRY